ncbi:hypothetical protein KY495_20040 [Massilia sp. PAMC28688]|uniref:hypothetical protein n=1 Tax=Massilia sp. PAMC28688 TaxID=2861283 RepID=UPI001C634195|nr:hypothetical protein [Massilia sp. PAMC28688]QYF92972.1 hypothetical protein KY495_20040 [Massilia sp. PAMC28688]
MPRLTLLLLRAAILASPLAAQAQQWTDDGGDRYERAPRIYWDGHCQVTQRISSEGELIERRRCRGDGAAHARAARADDDERYAPRYGDADRPRRRAPRYAGHGELPDYPADGHRGRRFDEVAPEPAYDERPVVAAPRVFARPVPAPLPARIIAQDVPVADLPAVARPARAPLKAATPARALAGEPLPPKQVRVVAQPEPKVIARVKAAPQVPAPKLAALAVAKPAAPKAAAPAKVTTKPSALKLASKNRVAVAAAAKASARRRIASPGTFKVAADARTAPSAAPKALASVKAVPRHELAARLRPVPMGPKAGAAQPPRVIARIEPARRAADKPGASNAAKVRPLPEASSPVLAKARAKPAASAARPVAPPRLAVAPAKPAVATKPAAPPAAPPAAARIAAVPAVTERVSKPAPAPVVKTSGSSKKSEWLVLLPPDAPAEKAEAPPAAKAVVDLDKSEPIVQSRVFAKGESYLRSTAYREYVMRKSSDPYSNLK